MGKRFLEAATPKHYCEIVKVLVVYYHENLVELIFVVWNLSSGLKLPEFRASICLNRSGRTQNWHEKKVFLCLREALLPTRFLWRPFFQHVAGVSWLDHFVCDFTIPYGPTH